VAAALSVIYSTVEIILGSSCLLATGSVWTSSVSFLSDGVWILVLEVGSGHDGMKIGSGLWTLSIRKGMGAMLEGGEDGIW
jgi:hypothetical protein